MSGILVEETPVKEKKASDSKQVIEFVDSPKGWIPSEWEYVLRKLKEGDSPHDFYYHHKSKKTIELRYAGSHAERDALIPKEGAFLQWIVDSDCVPESKYLPLGARMASRWVAVDIIGTPLQTYQHLDTRETSDKFPAEGCILYFDDKGENLFKRERPIIRQKPVSAIEEMRPLPSSALRPSLQPAHQVLPSGKLLSDSEVERDLLPSLHSWAPY